MHLFDVAIVGGGPAGSSCAASCAVAGLRTLVLDREKFPRENGHWKIETSSGEFFQARILIGADGRNSTVARLCNLFPASKRERVALQAHVPRPRDFGERVVLQFLPEGYSGQAPVSETQLNLCLVGTPPTISTLRRWAERQFDVPANQPWRTITPLTRPPIPSAHENL